MDCIMQTCSIVKTSKETDISSVVPPCTTNSSHIFAIQFAVRIIMVLVG